MPGFVVRGSLVYQPPFDYLLHAVSFGTSSFTSSRLFVEAFVQPHYHSYDYLTFTYGFRLGDDFWDIDEADPDRTFAAIAEEVRIHALPFFEGVPDLDRFCALIPEWEKEQPRRIMQHNSLDDPVVLEDLAYAAILRGNNDRAAELLEKAIASENESGEYRNDDLLADLEHILSLLQGPGLEAAQAQLDNWHALNVKRLKVDR
ncbi:MAG TPA: hypothetical protein VFU26_10865 [Gaiellaceae bacterium]|nr:hypothetical protein [Gaiellaceae bacterium]